MYQSNAASSVTSSAGNLWCPTRNCTGSKQGSAVWCSAWAVCIARRTQWTQSANARRWYAGLLAFSAKSHSTSRSLPGRYKLGR